MRIVAIDEIPTLDSLRNRVGRIRHYKPLWRYYRLMQYVPQAVGIAGLGLIDVAPDILLGKVEAGESREAIRHCIFHNWKKQIRNEGTTINFNIEQNIERPSILQYTEAVLQIRKKEIERVLVYLGGGEVNLQALWLTAWGYRVLNALGLELVCSRDQFEQVEEALEEVDVSVKTTTDASKKPCMVEGFLHPDAYPVNMSKGLAHCIWNVVRQEHERVTVTY